MNQIATTERNPMNSVAMSAGPSGSSIAPQSLGDVVRFAEVMCRADIALPKHLRGNAGACMAVAMQALEWQMSPFAVASKSYAVNGAIAYEAQLIAAVVNTRSGIKGRLKYFFEGEGQALTCRVVGILDGEECEYTSPTIGSITTKNSPLWKSDPQQQLGYFSARSWARRHCPEVILGVYDREEVEQFRGSENAKDVTPLSERLAMAKIEQHDASQEVEGFDPSFVARETTDAPDEAAIEQETPSIPEDVAAGSSSPQDDSAADQSAPPHPESGDGEVDAQRPVEQETASASPGLSDDDREFLVRVFKTMKAAVGPSVEDFTRAALIFTKEIASRSATVKAKATKIRTELARCCGEEPTVGTVTVGKYLAGLIGVDEKELAA